jgi:Lrp/AsnC family transcriptional regulator, regulator for asnA, asnC and gidA
MENKTSHLQTASGDCTRRVGRPKTMLFLRKRGVYNQLIAQFAHLGDAAIAKSLKNLSGSDASEDAVGSVHDLDAHDEAIIACLRQDGRMSVRELATQVGLNEATVRTRMRRLESTDTMRIVAMVDLGAVGFNFIAPVGITVKGRPVEDVGMDLARIPQVVTVSAAIGSQDLELQIASKNMAELDDILTRQLPAVAGVARIEASLSTKVQKYESPWVPFT